MTSTQQKDFIRASCEKYGRLSGAAVDRIVDVVSMLTLLSDMSDYEVFVDIKVAGEDVMFVIAEHLSPKSYYEHSYLGDFIHRDHEPAVFEAFDTGLVRESVGISLNKNNGGKIITNQRAIPIQQDEEIIAVLILEKPIKVQGEAHGASLAHSSQVSTIMLTLMEVKSSDYDLQVREGVMFFDHEGKLLYANKYCEDLYHSFGYVSIVGRHFDVLNLAEQRFANLLYILAQDQEQTDKQHTLGAVPSAKEQEQTDEQHTLGAVPSAKDQVSLFQESTAIVGTRYYRVRIAVLRELYSCVVMFVDDVTQTKRIENCEKGYLVTNWEMQHRIKNNLMTVASLLRMQARQCNNEQAQEIINLGVNRILSISATFDLLTRSNSATVCVLEVLRSIRDNHLAMLATSALDIEILVSGEDFILSSEESTTLGLVTNELIQNAIKHAFPGREQGRIEVTVASDYGVKIIQVCDNGVGFDPESIQHESLGFTIAKELVLENLGGKITIESGTTGTTVSLAFKQHSTFDSTSYDHG